MEGVQGRFRHVEVKPAAYNQARPPTPAGPGSDGEEEEGGVVSGADGKFWRPLRQPRSLFDLGLFRRAGWSLDLVGLPLFQFLLLLDLQDELLDLLTLRLHSLLREPVGQVDRQVETGNRILFEEKCIMKKMDLGSFRVGRCLLDTTTTS